MRFWLVCRHVSDELHQLLLYLYNDPIPSFEVSFPDVWSFIKLCDRVRVCSFSALLFKEELTDGMMEFLDSARYRGYQCRILVSHSLLVSQCILNKSNEVRNREVDINHRRNVNVRYLVAAYIFASHFSLPFLKNSAGHDILAKSLRISALREHAEPLAQDFAPGLDHVKSLVSKATYFRHMYGDTNSELSLGHRRITTYV